MIGDVAGFQLILKAPLSENQFHRVDLAVDGSAVVLRVADMKPFAVLNSKTSATIFNFLSVSSIRASALIAHAQVVDLIQNVAGGRRRRIVLLDINIYGHVTIKSSIGMQLSRAHLFLQDPDNLEDDMKYDNPHILTLPKPKFIVPKLSEDPEGPEISDHAKFDFDMRLIYSSLSRSLYLQSLEADTSIKTSLLP